MTKTDRRRTDSIRRILRTRYPQVKTQLDYETPFQLLVATILSAQCTDRQVNAVTKPLFGALPDPDAFAAVPVAELEKMIRSTGFFRNKARNIKKCTAVLLKRHNAQVPRTLEELVKLPGVGRKTANVVLGAAFGTPGIVVDTHVARISRRLDLTRNTDPVKIEFDLMAQMPRSAWSGFSLHLIYFGREICRARKPACPECPLNRLCRYPHKFSGPDTPTGKKNTA